MEFNVLGPVSVTSGSEPLSVGGLKPRTVLAMLISRAGQTLAVDLIAQAVYGQDVPTKARRVVQTYVSSLRSVVGDVIVKDGAGWSLRTSGNSIDAARFEDLFASTQELDPVDVSEVLRDALAIWRGDPYADIEAHGHLDGEIARLGELRITVLQARIDADLESGRQGDLIGELETLITEHPYQERFRAQHMLALYRAGRQSEALRAYQQMRELLVGELGVDPSLELQDLERRMLEQDDSLLPTPERTGSRRAVPEMLSTLPIPARALLGREVELRRIRAMLLDHRLVTLTGGAGCGKTRLAIEAADRELATLEHGAYFADLSVVSDDGGVALAVAAAVQLRVGGGDPAVRVVEYLADKQALVVLDNCEHVIDACAEFAEAFLGQRGEWRILATSRELLDVDGERVLQVPSLSVDGDGAAVGLFEARASELNPDFVVDDANRGTVVELCQRLDGMPLAIELAAARTAVMSPAELLDRIDDRFRVLSGGRRRSRQHRRTLEATLDWSYDLLDADEQNLLKALGVFRGSFDVAAAAAVAEIDVDVAIDLLEALIAKSLVVTVIENSSTRFRLLETIRVYAENHLKSDGALEAARNRHLEHHLVAVVESTIQEWRQLKPNLEAAVGWAIACDRHSDAGELLAAAGFMWHEEISGQSTLDRLDVVVAALPEHSALRERLRAPEIMLALVVGDHERVLAAARGAAQASDDDVRFIGLTMLARRSVMTDPDESLRLVEAAQAISVVDGYASLDSARAYIHMFAGEFEEALALLQPHVGVNDLVDGSVPALLLMDGRASEALEMADRHPVADSVGMYFGVTPGLCQLALGHRELAERELIADARSAKGIPWFSNSALIGLAALVHHEGDSEWAAEIILEAAYQRMAAIEALARMVAEQIGIRDEFAHRQQMHRAADVDATVYLRETLARWDAQHAEPQIVR